MLIIIFMWSDLLLDGHHMHLKVAHIACYGLQATVGKDRGKPPGVHDPTRTRTPEGYIPLPGGKGYHMGMRGT